MDDRLQKFARLVELGSFTQAANKLHISQPALTMAIAKLERELHATLLIRTQRRLVLTAAGQIVYAAAIEHKTTDENLTTRLVELARKRPKVVLGMVDSVAAALCMDVRPLDKLEAQADVSVVVNNSRYLRKAVTDRAIDLAFVVDNGTPPRPTISSQSIGTEPFVIVGTASQVEEAQSGLKKGALANFISYDQPSTTFKLVSEAFHKKSIELQPTFYSTSPDIILRMVLLGKGVAALPLFLTRDLTRAGNLTTLKSKRQTIVIERPAVLIKLSNKILPSSLTAFSKQAKSALELYWQDIKHVGLRWAR